MRPPNSCRFITAFRFVPAWTLGACGMDPSGQCLLWGIGEVEPGGRTRSALPGWSQPVDATLYLRGKRWSVGWRGDFIEVLLRPRRRSYGMAGIGTGLRFQDLRDALRKPQALSRLISILSAPRPLQTIYRHEEPFSIPTAKIRTGLGHRPPALAARLRSISRTWRRRLAPHRARWIYQPQRCR